VEGLGVRTTFTLTTDHSRFMMGDVCSSEEVSEGAFVRGSGVTVARYRGTSHKKNATPLGPP